MEDNIDMFVLLREEGLFIEKIEENFIQYSTWTIKINGFLQIRFIFCENY